MTDRAIKMNIAKLDELAKQSEMSVKEFLSEVICRGWAAFYPITQYGTSQQQKPASGGNVFLEIAKEEGVFLNDKRRRNKNIINTKSGIS